MRIFSFDPAEHRDRYAEQGWVHIRGGVDPDFLAELREFVERREGHHVEGRGIGGKKAQALYEFPSETDFPGELFDTIASVCGLDRDTMTLSERHLKAYDADAPADVPAHKDRFASLVSVGLSIDIPAESRLLLYPEHDRGVNPYNVSGALRERLEPDRLPEVVLKEAAPVEIDDEGGDVVMFPGSDVWHVRQNQADARNLYLKFNDFDCDPLGEDPSTPERRERTLGSLELGDQELAGQVPVQGRRLDCLTRQHSRDGGPEVVWASVWDETPVVLSPVELAVVGSARYGLALAGMAEELAAGDHGRDEVVAAVRRLGRRGVLDLLAPERTG
ncbi:MAG: hypothetical protein ACRDL0_11760 [Thermoleophilaceae bacterium]